MTTIDRTIRAVFDAWPGAWAADSVEGPEWHAGFAVYRHLASALLLPRPDAATLTPKFAKAAVGLLDGAEFGDELSAASILGALDAILEKRTPCSECKAKGWDPCTRCKEQKHTKCDCPDCTGGHECARCDGKGKIGCEACRGSGKTIPKHARVLGKLFQPAPLRAALAYLGRGRSVRLALVRDETILLVRSDAGVVWAQCMLASNAHDARDSEPVVPMRGEVYVGKASRA